MQIVTRDLAQNLVITYLFVALRSVPFAASDGECVGACVRACGRSLPGSPVPWASALHTYLVPLVPVAG